MSTEYDAQYAPIEELIKLKGIMAGQQVTVLKDDGCNTNVISKSFVNKNRHLLETKSTCVNINHSYRKVVEEASEVVVDGLVEIGNLKYKSNWIVADCRYDILLGMPWHVECTPTVDYRTRTLKAGNTVLPSSLDSVGTVKVNNIGVKKFRSLLKKKNKNCQDFAVFQLRNGIVDRGKTKGNGSKNDDEDLRKLKEEFQSVFRDDLPDGLPP